MLSLMNVACAEPAQNLSTSVNEFCWKYFTTLKRDENILYSPYGIHAALSILANGASGDTQREILNVLGTDNLEALNDAHKNFAEFAAKNYENFGSFNLLLINKKISKRGLEKNFKRVVNDVYKSDVREANFSGEYDSEAKKIAAWVRDKTNGFMENYYPIVTPESMTDSLNVIYFKGKWVTPFTTDYADNKFTYVDGTTGTLATMSNVFKNKITYLADDKFKGVELPYSAGAAMYLILPADDAALNVAELWNAETFSYRENFLDALSNGNAFNGEVVVRLPNDTTFEFERGLVENFKAMGIQRAFTDDAEFFNIVKDTSLKISNAKHYAKINIDKEGTEAAAVTEITMVETTATPDFEPPRTVYFIADRPFIFVIRDVESKVILFAGVFNH